MYALQSGRWNGGGEARLVPRSQFRLAFLPRLRAADAPSVLRRDQGELAVVGDDVGEVGRGAGRGGRGGVGGGHGRRRGRGTGGVACG